MLAKRPANRPQSAGAAVSALIERARASGAVVEEAPSAPLGWFNPSDSPREAETVKDAPRAEDVQTVRKAGRPKEAAEPSSPVVISVNPRMTNRDGASSGARTMLAAAAPASGTLLSAAPPSAAVRPSLPEATVNDDGGPPHVPERRSALPARRSPAWPYVAALAAIAVAVVFLQRSQGDRKPAPAESAPPASPASTATAPPSASVTIHLTVTPPDADVFVDDLRAGSAGNPLLLKRSDQSRIIRIEKAGYEPQSQRLTPDHDQDLGPIALRAAAAPPSAPTRSPAVQGPKRGDPPDIERPPQLKPQK